MDGGKGVVGYMLFTSVIAIILGLVMLFYPGGTMRLMQTAFIVFQVILSAFILIYAVVHAVHYFRVDSKVAGIVYLVIGALATALVWMFGVGIIYIIVALFLILIGIGEMVAGFKMDVGRYFMVFLGATNIMIGVAILSYPVILPLLIAWYVLFWGLSRFFFALELRKLTR